MLSTTILICFVQLSLFNVILHCTCPSLLGITTNLLAIVPTIAEYSVIFPLRKMLSHHCSMNFSFLCYRRKLRTRFLCGCSFLSSSKCFSRSNILLAKHLTVVFSSWHLQQKILTNNVRFLIWVWAVLWIWLSTKPMLFITVQIGAKPWRYMI